MSVQFREIQLPQNPSQWQPKNIKIASNFLPTSKPNVPEIKGRLLRGMAEIIADVESDRSDSITPLEWTYCLWAKAEWDIKNPDRTREISEAIWLLAQHNSRLKQQLLWRLALHHSHQLENAASSNSPVLDRSLVECFAEFANTATGIDALPVQIIKIFTRNLPEYELAKLSWQYLKTPVELLKKAQLPATIPVVDRAGSHLAGIFAKNQISDLSGVEWLLRCLKEMPAPHQLAAVEELLVSISTDIIKNQRSKLVEWLRSEYDPKLQLLSDTGKESLRRWIGELNYSYFQKTVDLVARMLRLSEAEIKQLEERRDFWANYSDRIQRVRLLLPQSSVSTIGYQLQFDVDILPEDGSELTEVCIFQLDSYYAMEFLRGSGAEIRLIPRSKESDRLLFVKKELSLKRIRKLGGEVHDRVFMWQSSCEKWLKQKKILPNEGTKSFQGMSQYYGKYDATNGLRMPEPQEQKEREVLLKKWQKQMENL
ncbi:MAG: EH signature domain-containing protein [Microcoleus sp. CAN_BIN18]|nr:EH signature domain-containing protein [Microcoleus sp. CAN_BIN18]